MESEGKDAGDRLLTTRRLIWLVATAALLALLALFVADNFVLIEVRLVNLDIRMRLAWALLLPAITGLAAGYLVGRFRR